MRTEEEIVCALDDYVVSLTIGHVISGGNDNSIMKRFRFKGTLHTKSENSVIIYSSSCCFLLHKTQKHKPEKKISARHIFSLSPPCKKDVEKDKRTKDTLVPYMLTKPVLI